MDSKWNYFKFQKSNQNGSKFYNIFLAIRSTCFPDRFSTARPRADFVQIAELRVVLPERRVGGLVDQVLVVIGVSDTIVLPLLVAGDELALLQVFLAEVAVGSTRQLRVFVDEERAAVLQ